MIEKILWSIDSKFVKILCFIRLGCFLIFLGYGRILKKWGVLENFCIIRVMFMNSFAGFGFFFIFFLMFGWWESYILFFIWDVNRGFIFVYLDIGWDLKNGGV